MTIIISEASDLLSARRRQIASERHALKARLSSLSTEDKDIAIAEAVLTRLGRTQKSVSAKSVA